MNSKLCAIRDALICSDEVDEIYDAVKKEDFAEIVLCVLKAMGETERLLISTIVERCKSEDTTVSFRTMGNKEFDKARYQHTMIMYNQALLFAPNDSKNKTLAISNRSAVLFKIKAYAACLKDIQTCKSMDRPPGIIEKLRKREKDVYNLIDKEIYNANLHIRYADALFKHDFTSHPQIPCISQDIKISDPIKPLIVAAKEIKPGTVVCREKAFVSCSNRANVYLSCHYCQKMSLNLYPCKSCCSALFCSDDCMNICYEEYHKYECHIIDAVHDICSYDMPNLMMKTIFKIKSKSKSWDEIVDESKKYGINRMKTSTEKEIFDSNYLFSVLNIRDDKPFVHGLLFNGSVLVATLLFHFERIPDFYPENVYAKRRAIDAIARIMLFFHVHQSTTFIYQALKNVGRRETCLYPDTNSGLFMFISKLKKSCTPNLFAVNKNNEIMLIAIQTIKPDEELTLGKPMHRFDGIVRKEFRSSGQFLGTGDICYCPRCTQDDYTPKPLSDSQKKFYNSLDFEFLQHGASDRVLQKILEALDVLKDVPYSNEYKDVFKMFRRSVTFYEAAKGENFILAR